MEIRIKPLQVSQYSSIARAKENCYNLVLLHATIGRIVQSLILQWPKSNCKAFLLIWLKKYLNPHEIVIQKS